MPARTARANMVYESQKRANNEYRKRSTKNIALRFYPGEEDERIYQWLKVQENTTADIKGLVKADMERQNAD